MMTDAELYDVAMKASVGVLILAAWTYVVLEQRDTRRRLDRHRADLTNHARRLTLHEHRAAATTVGQPMATVRPRHTRSARAIPAPRPAGQEGASGGGKTGFAQGGWVDGPLWGKENGPELLVTPAGLRSLQTAADPTLRLTRPPALSDLAAAILTAGRPLTRATLTEQLDRDTTHEIREALLAGRLQMVRTRDEQPAYWPTGHPTPGDTVRMPNGMSVLPGASR